MPDITKSQAIFVVLSYLSKNFTISLQILNRRFYNIILPSLLHTTKTPLPPQFLVLDFKSQELYTFALPQKSLDGSTYSIQDWQKSPLQYNEQDFVLNGGYKIIATSEYGGRYFICGGQR